MLEQTHKNKNVKQQKLCFGKHERLCGEISINKLFKQGTYVNIGEIKLIYLFEKDTKNNIKVLISVPKRLFKAANQRNLLKRRIREAYRKNKINLTEQIENSQYSIYFAFIINTPDLPSYENIENKILVSLQILCNILKKFNTDENKF